jgi:hypothetical protein
MLLNATGDIGMMWIGLKVLCYNGETFGNAHVLVGLKNVHECQNDVPQGTRLSTIRSFLLYQ